MRLKKFVHAAVITAAAGITGATAGALLGIVPGFPNMFFDNQGQLDYDATAQELSVHATPLFIRFTLGGIPRLVFPTGMPPEHVLSINIQVDNSGNLIGGVLGHDLRIVGEVDANGDTIIDYAGELLTGEILAFGYHDSGGTTDLYDFRFAVTGGSLAPLFAGQNIGLRVTSEQSNFVNDFSVDFGGEAKGDLGPISMLEIPCELDVNVEACVILPPPDLRNHCIGKVTQLGLKYTGDSCAATTHQQDPSKVSCSGDPAFTPNVRIRVSNKINPADGGARVWFDGLAALGSTVNATAANGGASNFASETFVHVFDLANNLLQTIRFHTSCSQPLSAGNKFGSLLIDSITTTNGGTVIYDDGSSPECVTSFSLPHGNNCVGKVKRLTLAYTGDNCSANSHAQDPSKITCNGDPMGTPIVRVRVSNKGNPNDGSAKVWFSGVVMLNAPFDALASNGGASEFASETWVHVFDMANNLLQTIRFHTSCSQPLSVGNQFGSIQVQGMETTQGGSVSLGVQVIYTVSVTNNSFLPVTNVVVEDSVFGPVPGSPIASIGPGETVVLQYTENVFDTVLNVVTAIGLLNGEQCGAQDSAMVTSVPPPTNCCEFGKPRSLLMRYTGSDCSATNHSQDPSKVSCSGPLNGEPIVRIRASNKSNPGDLSAKVWFSGFVPLGDTFELKASNANQSRFESETFLHFYNAANVLIQTVRFHTSCSQPLFSGDQFGAAELLGCVGENEPNAANVCQGKVKIKSLVMTYNGKDCSANSHSQDAGKVACNGNPAFAGMVRIRASDKSNPNDGAAKVYYNDVVLLNTQFDIVAAVVGDSTLRSETFIHVFDLSNNLLQSIKFHTSCSQPLGIGDQFGSVQVYDANVG